MFGRKDSNMDNTETAQAQDATTQNPASPRAAAQDTARISPAAATLPGGRRQMEMPHGRRASAALDRDRGSMMAGEERKLIVGKGLSLSGEITACDVLVVEGKVEARLTDGKLLEITETGQFRGSVEIENADIAGRYDGDLTVHGRLTLRGTGRISGMVKYGELEVNAGGQIIGELQVVGGGAASTGNGPSFKNAAKFTAAQDDEDTALFTRKTAVGA